MGQYYAPVNLDKLEYLSSFDYDNGLKLMEHSYVGNLFVGAVERLLANGGDWYMNRIVWAGDYADKGKFLDAKYSHFNAQSYVEEEGVKISPYTDKQRRNGRLKYIVNHDKKQYLNIKENVKKDDWNMEVHPLPLLTCDGNGRGGGDYHGWNMEYVGAWAGDRISMEQNKAFLQDYTEIRATFYEAREVYGGGR